MAKEAKATTRVPVMVDESIHEAFREYSAKSGAPVAFLIREALTEWSETVLAARGESLDKVVCI
jgi:hypothetical protein